MLHVYRAIIASQEIELNNVKLTEPIEILEEMYSHKHIDKIEESVFYRYHKHMNKLSDNESSKLDLEITLNELHTHIFSTKNNKSPDSSKRFGKI